MVRVKGLEPVSYTHLDVYKRQAAAGQERCVRSACSNEAEHGEDRTADENCLLAADAVGEGTCHKTTDEVADHGNRVEPVSYTHLWLPPQ